MVADYGNDILARVAAGETLELDAWPALQSDILVRLEKIAHTEFAVPSLPPPPKLRRAVNNGAATSSSPTQEPSSQEANKENAPVPTGGEAKDSGNKTERGDEQPCKEPTTTTTSGDSDTVMEKADEAALTETPNRESSTQTSTQPAAADDGAPSSESIAADDGSGPSSSQPKLPIQLATMLGDIRSHIQTFVRAPPHTLQRLAELVLHPRAHYRALATYLHAVDRVVQVTSGLNTYPLPPAIPDMSSMHINGADGSKDPAAAVSWSTPTVGANAAAAVGSDEALGGALLTPIPWLTRRSPESVDAASTSSGAGSSTGGASSSGGGSGVGGGGGGGSGAQIHSECTETIDGPNGVGSIETVSVSVNGVPSTGHARGVTQGELLRQEQRAGVVPVSQLSRNGGHPQHMQQQHHALQSQREAHGDGSDEDEDEDHDHHHHHQPMDEDRRPQTDAPAEEGDGKTVEEEEEEMPHARGPDEIGVGDTGPQTATTSTMGEGGLEMQGIDVAAAVGRPREQEEHPQASSMLDEDEHADAKTEATTTTTTTAEEPEEGTGTKREAEDAAEGEPAKKLKEE